MPSSPLPKHRRRSSSRSHKRSGSPVKRSHVLFGSTFISIGVAAAYAGVVFACLNGVFHEMTEHDCKAGVSAACQYLMLQK